MTALVSAFRSTGSTSRIARAKSNENHWVLVGNLSSVVLCMAEGTGRVGFIVSPQTASALEDVSFVSDRILHLKLRGREQKTYLYSAYAPTVASPLNERESFFSHLQSDIQSLPARLH